MDGEVDRGGGFRGGTGGIRVELGQGSGGGNVATEENAVGTLLLVEKLHWWTTDEQLESEAAKYGNVKEVKFFEVTESGKSSGQCHVEFYDPASAAACKVWMNGHPFNEKPCVVNFASPCSLKRMEAQVIRNQECWKRGRDRRPKTTRGPNAADPGTSVGGRGLMGNAGSRFRQGIGAAPSPMYPNSMMAHGFGPAFGGPMGTYGGFPGAPAPPFSGFLPSYAPAGGMWFPGIAPPVNPASFGRGMPTNGKGIMPGTVAGSNMGMWAGPSMGGWGSEAHGGGREGGSSYREEAVSDHHYSRDRETEKDRDQDKDRDRCRDDRDRIVDHHRYRDGDGEHDEDSDRGRSSKIHSKSRSSQPQEDRSRDSDYEKR